MSLVSPEISDSSSENTSLLSLTDRCLEPLSVPDLSEQLLMLLMVLLSRVLVWDLSRVLMLDLSSPRLLMVSELDLETLGQTGVWREIVEQGLDLRLLL